MQRSTVEAGNLNCVIKYTEEERKEKNIKRLLYCMYVHMWSAAVESMGQFYDENIESWECFEKVKPPLQSSYKIAYICLSSIRKKVSF